MDEDAFRAARAELNPLGCVFEKVILTRFGDCSQADRKNIAERETVSCRSLFAFTNCTELRGLLRANSAFALKMIEDAPIPHGKDIKVQCGGLIGIQRVLDIEPSTPPVSNVFALVGEARNRFGAFTKLPFGEIIQSVVAYQARRPKKRSTPGND